MYTLIILCKILLELCMMKKKERIEIFLLDSLKLRNVCGTERVNLAIKQQGMYSVSFAFIWFVFQGAGIIFMLR